MFFRIYKKLKKIYNKIPNSIFTILLLVIFWFFIYYFYNIYFIENLKTIKIYSKVWEFNVELSLNNWLTKEDFFCKDVYCELKNLSEFTYNIKIKKEWYISLEKTIDLKKNDQIYIDPLKINLLEKIWEKIADTSLSWAISDNRNSLLNDKDFSINIKDNLIFIYYKTYNIWQFEYITWDIFDIYRILWDANNVYLTIWNNKYILNTKFFSFKKLIFPFDLIYIKKYKDFIYQFVSKKWVFLYYINEKRYEYIDIFSDFIIKDGQYIWYIRNDDTRRKTNLWYENIKWNLIISFNILSKEKKIIKILQNDLLEIFLDNNDIIILLDDFSLNKIIF